MVARRRRTRAATSAADEPNREASRRSLSKLKRWLNEESVDESGSDAENARVAHNKKEHLENDEGTGSAVQLVHSSDADGYNADAEDGDESQHAEDDIGYVRDSSISGAQAEAQAGFGELERTTNDASDAVGKNSEDDDAQSDGSESESAFDEPVRQVEHVGNGVPDEAENERMSDVESYEETDEREPENTTGDVEKTDEQMSEAEDSNEESHSAEAAQGTADDLLYENEPSDEDSESGEESDKRETASNAAEDPHDEEEVSSEHEESSENEGVMKITNSGNTVREMSEGPMSEEGEDASDEEDLSNEEDVSEEEDSSVADDAGDQDDATVMNALVDAVTAEGEEEQASEEGESSGDGNSVEITPALTCDQDGEKEEGTESGRAANEGESVAEAEENSDMGERDKMRTSNCGKSGGYGSLDEDAAAHDDSDAAYLGKLRITCGESADSYAVDETRDADDRAKEKRVEEQANEGEEDGSSINDGEVDAPEARKHTEAVTVEQDKCADEDEEDIEEDGDDNVNTREYKLVPLTSDTRAKQGPADRPCRSTDVAGKNEKERGEKEQAEKRSRKRTAGSGHGTMQQGSKTGVIYLPRIPPGMDVTALRSLLARTTQPKRMWLRPETKEQRRQRQALGGSRRKERFRDGWVELQSSKEARRVVELLNGRPMTAGKRRGRWGDDLWCLKYLKRFGWDDLTKEVFGGRERVLRVRERVMDGRRERAWIEARGKGRGEKVRRFRQKRIVEDIDEVRAREAGERVDREVEQGITTGLDGELAGLLFKRRKIGT